MFAAMISRMTGGRQLHSTAGTIAAQSLDSVWSRVRTRLPLLGINEARGYIRARAIPVIRDRLATMIESGNAPASRSEQLLAMAGEQVVGAMLQRLTAAPGRATVLRRAA